MAQVSNKTFTISSDKVEHTVPNLQLGLPAARQYSSSSPPPSPDSNGSVSNLSDRDAISSPDVNMLDCCLSEGSPVDNSYTNNLTQDNVLCSVSTNLNQTFIATPVNNSIHFWNANLPPVCNHAQISERYQIFSENAEDGGNSEATSPDSSGRESQMHLSETSHRGSTENECCSLSSGEMVLRSNSFCLEDQSLSLVSSLEESSVSLAASSTALPAESNLLSTIPLDVYEKSLERVIEESTSHPCLGMTFIQAELPATENDMVESTSPIALPGENEGGLLVTFVCETSPADSGKDAQIPNKSQLLLSETVSPEQSKSSVSTLSAVHDSKDIQTSTPLQNGGNKVPSLPSFSESPCSPNTGSPGLHPKKQQQVSVASKRLVAGLVPKTAKLKKIDIKKFPKSDFSSVKSKVVTRHVNQMSASGSHSQHKSSQVYVNNNKQPEVQKRVSIRTSPTKMKDGIAAFSVTTKIVSGAQRQGNSEGANVTKAQPSVEACVEGQGNSGAPSHNPSTNKPTLSVLYSNVDSETVHSPSNQVAVPATEHAGNQTFCLLSFEKSPDRSGQKDPKPTPKKSVSNKIEVRTGSALGQDKPTVLKTRPRCSSESSSSSSRALKEKIGKVSDSFTIPKGDTDSSHTKLGNLRRLSQNKKTTQAEATNGPAENTTRSVKKISLVAESSKSATAGASWDENKKRLWQRPSPRKAVGTLLSHTSAARTRTSTLPNRLRQPTLGRDECKTSSAAETPQSKPKSNTDITDSRKAAAAGEPSLGNTGVKPQLNGLRPPQTPSHTSLVGLPPTPASRPSRKTLGRSSVHNELHESAGGLQVSGGAAQKPTPLKTALLRSRLFTTPAKNTGQGPSTASKSAASLSKGAPNSAISPTKRTSSARFVGLALSGHVDKNKAKASSRHHPPQQRGSAPSQGSGPPDVVPASAIEGGRTDQNIQQLKGLLAASNCRFEAFAVVLQQILTERDDATRQCRSLSQELVNLQGELACSVHSSERLEKEKEELRIALEDALHRAQEQHQKDLAELEQRLQAFYQAEWDKVHLTYQEEANKCKSLMEQQMEELKASHEAMKQELESRHTGQLQCVKNQYEMSLEELTKVHTEELQSLDKTLKDTEAALSGQIEELATENKVLLEKFTTEENRRKELAESSQKDSHTLYLEQELESLKVVLDIKNKQLHQQEKKMIELDKLRDKNVKLDESLKKVQQENEDLKARMDRHAALSRQLSTEQAVLQESLQKESKVNKRLSMENEELLWKLHNGDLSSPRRVSPTSASPSHSFSLQSPRSSGLFSSPPVSPR